MKLRVHLWLHGQATAWFSKIAEPRIIRLMQFGVYLCMIFAGIRVVTQPPKAFEFVLGNVLVLVFGGFILIGALFGAVAVLPGIWWLERAGLIALATGMTIYAVVITSLGASPMGVVVAVAFALTFVQRFLEIRGSQLAPREE